MKISLALLFLGSIHARMRTVFTTCRYDDQERPMHLARGETSRALPSSPLFFRLLDEFPSFCEGLVELGAHRIDRSRARQPQPLLH